MPRTKEANQRLRAAQRARILDGALRAFARKGIAATMSDVAESAAVSQGLAYRYFASKDALFNELLEQAAQSRLTIMQSIQEMSGTAGERLDFLISKSLANMHEHPEFYRLSAQMYDDETVPDSLRDLLRRQSQTYQDVMRQLIVEAQAAGEVAAGDPDQLVMAVTACLRGLSILGTHSPEEFKKHFPEAGIILRMLKP